MDLLKKSTTVKKIYMNKQSTILQETRIMFKTIDKLLSEKSSVSVFLADLFSELKQVKRVLE